MVKGHLQHSGMPISPEASAGADRPALLDGMQVRALNVTRRVPVWQALRHGLGGVLAAVLCMPAASWAADAAGNGATVPVAPTLAPTVATSVGAVPEPTAAVIYNPNAQMPTPEAAPAPAQAASAASGTVAVVPTTADSGTLIAGGRRQTVSFADLGAVDPLQLHGTDSQNGVPFSVRRDEVVTGAMLHLIYSYSPALMSQLSQLKVLINGEVAATLPLPRDQGGMLVARDIAIDPRFVTEFNHLNLQLIAHYTPQCEDPSNSALWATVSNASSLDLTYATLPVKADLATLPLPFFDRRDIRRLQLPFVFAKDPSNGTLEAAGLVASWFGSLAGYRGALFPAQLDTLPSTGNAVVFATTAQKPAGLNLPAINGPQLMVVDRDAPARGKLLLVLGRSDDELKLAARALGLGQTVLTGASATIGQITELAPRQPYDAPNWLPTDRPVRVGELTQARDLSVTGYNADSVRVDLHIPPDLFMWQSRGVPLDLTYRYSVRPVADGSSLNINIGNNFVQSLPIPAKAGLWAEAGRAIGLGAILPDGTAVAHRTLLLPPSTLSARTQLRLHFFYAMPKTGACQSQVLDNAVGAIDPNSTIDFSGYPHYMALPDLAAFATEGFPFTRMADLSQTAAILPDNENEVDLSLYLLAMGRMGASTGYPVTGVTVAHAQAVDQYADKDLLIIGGPGRQSLLQRWARSMPFSSTGDARTFELSDLVYTLADWWRGSHGPERVPARADLSLVGTMGGALITGFESPLQSGRSAVALIGTDGQSSADLSSALLNADMIGQIQGAMDVIHDNTVTVTSNGNVYYIGHLPPVAYMRWVLSSHPLLLVLGGLLAALIIAAIFYRALRLLAARRLRD